MGNAHITGPKRMGVRPARDAEVVWKAEPFEFDSAEVGVAPGELVAEVHVDKLVKLDKIICKWVVEDSFAAPKDLVLAEWTSPLIMETVTSYCSLPNPWPAGRYRVDVYLGESQEVAGSLRFAISARGNQLESAVLTHEGVPFEVMDRSFGPIRVVFGSRFKCDVRENSQLEWYFGDSLLLRLDVPPGSHNVFHSDLRLDEPWPTGSYQVRLILDGNLVHTKHFECRDGWAGRVFSKTTPGLLSPASGELFAVFNIATKQTIRERAEVAWMFEDGTQIAKVNFAAGVYDTVNSNVSLAPGTLWPVGGYAVELHIDGATVARKTFRIAPAVAEEAKK